MRFGRKPEKTLDIPLRNPPGAIAYQYNSFEHRAGWVAPFHEEQAFKRIGKLDDDGRVRFS